MRVRLAGLAVFLMVLALAPASAQATGETLTVTPSSPASNGSPSFTDTVTLNATEAAMGSSIINVHLTPGLLMNLDAQPSCLQTRQVTGTTCLIGTYSSTSGATSGNVYLVPPLPATNVAGIELDPTSGPSFTGVALMISSNGAGTLLFALPMGVSDLTINLNSTLNGQPLNRMPSSCPTTPADNTMSVEYSDSTNATANDPFPVTGCSSLPYNPQFAISAKKDATDNGVAVTTVQTQLTGESSSQRVVLGTPSNELSPNLNALPLICGSPNSTFSNCHSFGTATSTSPLLPGTLSGNVYITGSAVSPSLVVAFPSPVPIQLTGAISVADNTVTFNNLPDVPLTNLTVSLAGGPDSAFSTECTGSGAAATAAFTPWSGTATVNRSQALTVQGCASTKPPPKVGKPTATGSLGGLAAGHPRLHVSVTHGSNAPDVSSVAIGVPNGLSFRYSTHLRCTGTGRHRKCRRIRTIRGLSAAGVKSATISGGKLVIVLRKPAASLGIGAVGPLLVESKALQKNVKKHKVKSLTVTVVVKDAKGAATAIALKLKAS